MELPRRYGHYVLLERIAVGGMGEIFRAKYAGLAGFERLCAIKRILPHLSDDEEFVDRLISEAMIAVQLSHAGIVQIYELGKLENEYFIAMEWVDGPDLSTLHVKAKAKDLPMPLPLGIHVVREIARAVDYAHRKTDGDGRDLQIVHRDISPQNVMLTLDGAAKLGDFGIARAGGIARRFATDAGAVLGKRRYMSPEQRRGENVDARTDVYALAAMLYECVTGQPPEPDADVPPMSSLAKEVPPELDAVAARALAADPAQRTATAAELAEGLERVFVRMASAPGALRDPGPELGRYVRKVCPPGEKQPQRRSLTDRIRAAMRPGASTRSPMPTPTLGMTGELDLPEPELPGDHDGVTIVGSAVISRSLPEVTPATGVTPGVMPAIQSIEADRKPRAPAPTMTAARPALSPDATEADDTGVGPRVRGVETVTGPSAVSRDPVRPAATASTVDAPVRPLGTVTAAMPVTEAAAMDPTPGLEVTEAGPPSPVVSATPAPDETELAPAAAAPPPAVRAPAPTVINARGDVDRRTAASVRRSKDFARPTSVSAPSGRMARPASPSRPAVSPASAPSREPSRPSRVRPAPAPPLFPARPPRRIALFAGVSLAALVALAAAGAWAGGFFAGDPPAMATAVVVDRRPDTPRPTEERTPPRRTPKPERTAVAQKTPAPERTRATPAPTRTRVVVAPTPAPTETPQRIEYGMLVVNAKPWARVAIDGKDQGQTPIKGLRLTAGTHRVVLEHPTHGRVERTVTIAADGTERVIVDFKSLPEGPGSP